MAKISPSKVADEIDPSKARRTYLITYSQADIDAFPTRESFAKVLKEAFSLFIELCDYLFLQSCYSLVTPQALYFFTKKRT